MIDRRRLLGLGTAAALGPGLPALGAGAAIPSNPAYDATSRSAAPGSRSRTSASARPAPTTRIWCATRWIAASRYFDTAESYAAAGRRRRSGGRCAACATGWCSAPRPRRARATRRRSMMAALEGSLRRLQTDHLDIYFNHAVNERRAPAEPGVVGVHRARQAAGQDPLSRHVRPRQPARRMPGLCDRARARRRRAGRLQLRPGSRLSTSACATPRFRRHAARAAARAREGEGEERRRDRDEDADRRAPERHAPLRARGLHLRAGGVPLGAVQPARRRARSSR